MKKKQKAKIIAANRETVVMLHAAAVAAATAFASK